MKLDFAALAQKQRIARMQRRVLIALAGLSAGPIVSQAAPTGGRVTHGHGSITRNGSQTTIRAGNNAVFNWETFNIAKGETTTFVQPSAASVAWNRITDKNPSQIFGNLNANGFVVLFNRSGFYFGPDSVVKVGGLLVSTAPMTMPGEGGGANWSYNGPPPTASIINYGKMETKNGGSLFLVAEKIENHGTLMAPDGTLGLYAGKEVLVSESPDGRGLSAKVTLPEGSIDNTGKLIADAGTIAMHAQTVNNGGLIQANSFREHNGVIELIASDSINLAANSIIQAKGDSTGKSAGGSITLKSEGQFADTAGSIIDVRGGAVGGDGGSVEISAKQISAIHSHVDGTAQPGFQGGALLIDPTDIVFGFNNGGNPDAFYYDPTDSSTFAGMAHITFQADRDIFLNQTVNLSADSDRLLTLEAGRDIIFAANASINASSGWSVSLIATAGGIYLNGGPDFFGARQTGGGAIQMQDGNVNLHAGTDVFIGSGYVRTVAGGNINITAGGDVDSGTNPNGYLFNFLGPILNSRGLGGIATGAGGNIFVHADGDIVTGPSAIGAYAPGSSTAAGNVTLEGRNVQGRFLVHNGVGKITAQYDFGSAASPGNLALASGSWDVHATHDIFLNEVYNPNGSQNSNGGVANRFRFDYAPTASVALNGGHAVHLLGTSPIHAQNNANSDRPAIYAPSLTVEAGMGGIELGNDLVLAPSPLGNLSLKTTAGGSLFSTPGNSYQIVMSDSDSTDYKTFVAGHSAVPLHLADTTPVTADISGNVENVLLQVPKLADIRIRGNTLNFAFEGQNLDASHKTTIHVDGDIRSRGNRTSVDPTTVNAQVFDPKYTINSLLNNKLIYDDNKDLSQRKLIGFVGQMSALELDFLLHPQIKQFDNLGKLVVDAQGNPILKPVEFAATAKIQSLFDNSQDIPSSPNAFRGLQLGGPGTFKIEANNVDLGVTGGIRSQGTLLNPAISTISPKGANIDLHVDHDLNMGSSQIASFAGGDIKIVSDNKINVGSATSVTGDDTPKGIFSSSGGNVSVTAENGINVNGSRIATYNGGNLSVISHHGNIDAGAGGLGSVSVFRTVIDPKSGEVSIVSTTIPGSGILATTLPGTDTRIGNVTVKAEDGSVIASAGGVLQLSFNGVAENKSAKIDISAFGHKSDPSKGNIEAKNSGIIGAGNVKLDADGDITGLVIAQQDIDIKSLANVSVTALAQSGTATVGGANVSGSTIVGGAGASVTAATVSDSTIVANNASVSGAQSGVQAGVGQTSAATTAGKVNEDASTTVAKKTDEDEEEKKKKKPIQLARTVSRVTVILPEKTK